MSAILNPHKHRSNTVCGFFVKKLPLCGILLLMRQMNSCLFFKAELKCLRYCTPFSHPESRFHHFTVVLPLPLWIHSSHSLFLFASVFTHRLSGCTFFMFLCSISSLHAFLETQYQANGRY